MKRIIAIIIFVVSVVTVYAKPPRLAVEELFDGRYNTNKNVTTSIYKNNGNYYRALTVTGNSGIVSAIMSAIKKDSPRASNYSDHNGNDSQYISLRVVNNGETIYIGLQREESGDAFFFIQGKEKAFE